MADLNKNTPPSVRKLFSLRHHWIAQLSVLLTGILGLTAGVFGNIDSIESSFTGKKDDAKYSESVALTSVSGISGNHGIIINQQSEPSRRSFLTQNVADRFIMQLDKTAPIQVVCGTFEPDCYSFAQEIKRFLRSAGYRVSGSGEAKERSWNIEVDPYSNPATITVKVHYE